MEEKYRSTGAPIEARVVCFGPYKLDLRSAELRKNNVRVRLQDQPVQILVALLDRPGELVLREEIRQKLWRNDTIVEFDHSINAAVKQLRDAPRDSAENPRYIETVARRGYRFIAAVEAIPPLEPVTYFVPRSARLVNPAITKSASTTQPSATQYRAGRWILGGAAAVLLGAGIAIACYCNQALFQRRRC